MSGKKKTSDHTAIEYQENMSESFFEHVNKLLKPLSDKIDSIDERLKNVAGEATAIKISREQLEQLVEDMAELHLKVDNAFMAPGTGGKVVTSKNNDIEHIVTKLEGGTGKKTRNPPNNMQFFRAEYLKDDSIFDKTYVPEEGGETDPKTFKEKLFKEHSTTFKDKKTSETRKKHEASLLWKYGMNKDQKARVKEYQKDLTAKNNPIVSRDAKPDINEDDDKNESESKSGKHIADEDSEIECEPQAIAPPDQSTEKTAAKSTKRSTSARSKSTSSKTSAIPKESRKTDLEENAVSEEQDNPGTKRSKKSTSRSSKAKTTTKDKLIESVNSKLEKMAVDDDDNDIEVKPKHRKSSSSAQNITSSSASLVLGAARSSAKRPIKTTSNNVAEQSDDDITDGDADIDIQDHSDVDD